MTLRPSSTICSRSWLATPAEIRRAARARASLRVSSSRWTATVARQKPAPEISAGTDDPQEVAPGEREHVERQAGDRVLGSRRRSGHRPAVDRAAGGLVEWVAPVPNIVPGQLLALALAGRGLDPERPPGLSMVTLTN